MSLIDDLLVLVDSYGSITLDNAIGLIGRSHKQIIASSLGRLTAKQYLEKKIINNNINYQCSKIGKSKINEILDSIKIYDQKRLKDNSWTLVIFDIPENSRSVRDAFRNSLISIGFGKLQDSIWVSYHKQNNYLDQIIKLLNISKNVTIINTNNLNLNYEIELVKKIQWNWKQLNNEYQEFIENSKKYLSNKNKTSYNAKKLVYNFAKIMHKDPKLPEILQQKNALTSQAFNIYQKIRPYCYQ